MEATARDVLERIAQLHLLEVPNRQIAAAVRLSEGRISQLQATDEYKAILSERSVEYYQKQAVVNDGWDALEAHAINGLMKHMEMTSDPNLMLRVAAVANKATRRGQFQNNPINTAGAAGARVIIQLQNNFVDKLMSPNFQLDVSGKRALQIQQKQSDSMPVSRLQDLLSVGKQGDDLLPNLPDQLDASLDMATIGNIE